MAPNELQELAPIAEALNTESNDINNIIAKLNTKLASLNLGTEVWMLTSNEESYEIGYAKVDVGNESSWQLATRIAYAGGAWDNLKPLLQAPRAVRIRALEMLPLILRDLKEKAERNLQAIRAAKKLAAEL